MPKQPPRSLWTDRDDDAHERWLSPDPEAPTVAYQRDPRPARPVKKRVWRRRVLALMAIVVLAGGGVAVGQRLGNDTDIAGNQEITLPVVKGKTQETRANEIYAQVKSGVVQIKTGSGSGTGFVVNKNGTIVTNAHVVSGSTNVKVYFDDSNDGIDGVVTGRDVSSDLAAVKVDPNDVKLTPLALADSDDVNPGDQVLAIGYPLGLDRTLTEGIVSGLGRQIRAQNGFSIDKVIQTDASINPGNSGGPLIDSRGRVIGVNSQIATSSAAGGNTGIGFAVPSNTVRAVVPKLAAGQTVKHAYLGVSLTTGNNPGAEVADVTAGGPSDRGGLRAGDLVTSIDGTKVETSDGLISSIAQMAPGQEVELSVKRGGGDTKVKVTLGERPNNAASAQQSSGGSGGGSGGGGGNPFQIP